MFLAAPVRSSLGAVAVVCALVTSIVAGAQTVAPPLVEYRGGAFASFALRNDALVPMTVVLEPYGFTVDSLGRLAYEPFDSTRIRLRVSATSLRIPPRGSATVSYEVASDSLPSWCSLTATFIPPRTRGLNLRAQLPHVIYLYQNEALTRDDVAVTRVEWDSAGGRARVRVENRSNRLGRMRDGSMSPARGDAQPVESFPLFPHSVRWLELPWSSPAPPVRVHLEFDAFSLDDEVRVSRAAPAP